METQGVQRSLLSTAYHAVTQTVWGQVAMVVTVVALLIFIARKTRPSVPEIPLIPLAELMKPFKLSKDVRAGSYIAWSRNQMMGRPSPEEFLQLLIKSRASIIVSLIHENEPESHLKSDELRLEISEGNCLKQYSGKKTFIHFHQWEKDSRTSSEHESYLIFLARNMSLAVNQGETLSVYSSSDSGRLAAFVAMVEFSRRRDHLQTASDAKLIEVMQTIVGDLLSTASGRCPSSVQSQMLNDLALLKQLILPAGDFKPL